MSRAQNSYPHFLCINWQAVHLIFCFKSVLPSFLPLAVQHYLTCISDVVASGLFKMQILLCDTCSPLPLLDLRWNILNTGPLHLLASELFLSRFPYTTDFSILHSCSVPILSYSQLHWSIAHTILVIPKSSAICPYLKSTVSPGEVFPRIRAPSGLYTE